MKSNPEVMDYINDLTSYELIAQWNEYCYGNNYDCVIRSLESVLKEYSDRASRIKCYGDMYQFMYDLLKDFQGVNVLSVDKLYMIGDTCHTNLGWRMLGTYKNVFVHMRSDLGFIEYMHDMMIYDDDWLTKNGYNLEGNDNDDD